MTLDVREAQSLASCAATLQGKFCHDCGEKAFDPHDHSLKHFVAEGFHTFTHLDSKFLQSLKLLLSKPGVLTREYLAGRKKHFMKPLAIFIIANLLFFLFIYFQARRRRL